MKTFIKQFFIFPYLSKRINYHFLFSISHFLFALSFFLIVQCTLLIDNCNSQWFWQNPLPTGVNLNKVLFVNQSTGWIIGDGGTRLKTTDGGQNWTFQKSSNPLSQLYISALDENNLIIMAEDSTYRTENGGTSWSRAYFPYPINSYINYCDINTMYAMSTNVSANVFFKSTNNGNDWIQYPIYTIENEEVHGCIFLNSNTGIFFGSSNFGGTIKKTTDGGMNFVTFTMPYQLYQYITDVHILNENIYYAIGPNRVYKTTDSGLNWYDKTNGLTYDLRSIYFFDANTGIVAADSGRIYRTTNGGGSWEKTLFTFTPNGYKPFINSVRCLNTTTAIAAGDNGLILRTTNAGLNWTYISNGFRDNINTLSFGNLSNGIIASDFGNVLVTTNSGYNWTYKGIGTSLRLFGVKMITATTGFVCGEQGRIYRTTNLGTNWNYVNSSASYWLTDINFMNTQTGYAVGSSGTILKSTNGGYFWSVINSGVSDQFFNVNPVSLNTVFAFSNRIRKSNDGGSSWVTQILDTNSNIDIFSSDFLNDNTGYIGGVNVTSGHGVVFKTTNGGTNWDLKFSIYLEEIYSIDFYDINNGIITGAEGVIYKTTNGGDNWDLVYKAGRYSTNNFVQKFNAVRFIDSLNIIAGGSYGILVRSTTGGSTFIKQISNSYVPASYHLYQNYPNPFNPTTIIKYSIPPFNSSLSKGGLRGVTLKVYDLLGREVVTLVNEKQSPGTYEVTFDARHGGSSGLASGIYFYKLTVSNPEFPGQVFSETKKLVLLK